MAKATVLVPGTVLKDLLDKYNIPVAKVSDDIGLSPSAVRQIINNKLKISIVIALKLAKYFGKKPEYWINLQTSHELTQLQKDSKVSAELKKIPEAKKLPPPEKKPAKPAKSGRTAKSAKDAAKPGAKPRGRPGRKPGSGKAAAAAPVEKKPRKPRTTKPKPAPETSSFSDFNDSSF
jgi:addiction module HigA family antidote